MEKMILLTLISLTTIIAYAQSLNPEYDEILATELRDNG